MVESGRQLSSAVRGEHGGDWCWRTGVRGGAFSPSGHVSEMEIYDCRPRVKDRVLLLRGGVLEGGKSSAFVLLIWGYLDVTFYDFSECSGALEVAF